MNDADKVIWEKYIEKIEAALQNALTTFAVTGKNTCSQEQVLAAMRYSVNAGGKRIRPIFVLEFCKACGGSEEAAMPAACAIEMLHTFSLIHDDLPCMDDDDLRRGKPSCHKAFPEATALLAGDGLTVYALEHLAKAAQSGVLSPETAIALLTEITHAVGVDGMIGGQILDLQAQGKAISREALEELHLLKTGALIKASCKAGCIAAGGTAMQIDLASQYGENIGLAFQIIDDILDITGDAQMLGKPIGSDDKHQKTTYVTLYGLEAAKTLAARLTEHAQEILLQFPGNGFLQAMTTELLIRQH